MSTLTEHARHELELLGEDPATIDGYLRMIEIFSSMGHSGGSASVFIPTLTRLLQYRNLTPITDNPDEWYYHGIGMWPPDGIWQNRRNSEAFSTDGGKHYYLTSETTEGLGRRRRKKMHTAVSMNHPSLSK